MSFVITAYSTPDRMFNFKTPFTEMMHQLYLVAVIAAMLWVDAFRKNEIPANDNPFGPNVDLIMDISAIFKQVKEYVDYTMFGMYKCKDAFKKRPDFAFWESHLNSGERTELCRVSFIDTIECVRAASAQVEVLYYILEKAQDHRVWDWTSYHIVFAKFLELSEDQAAAQHALQNEPDRDKAARIVGTNAIAHSYACPLCAPTGSFYCDECNHCHPPEDKSLSTMCRHCTGKPKYIAPSALSCLFTLMSLLPCLMSHVL